MPLVRNLRTLATAFGGLSVDEYVHFLAALRPRAELLPQVTEDVQGLLLDELLEGVRPDILGELYVLDRLASRLTRGVATRTER